MQIQVALSKEQVREIIKCSRSIHYFADNYAWIQIPEQGAIVPFQAHPYQRELLQWMQFKENGVIFKDRRVGASTAVAVGAAWYLCFRPGVNLLFLSIKETEAIQLLDKVKFVLYNLADRSHPDIAVANSHSYLRPEIITDNKQLIEIGWRDDNGNIIKKSSAESLTTTGQSARGKSATFIFLDELAFLPNGRETFAAASPATTWGGFWIAVSTANSTADKFYDLVADAWAGKNHDYHFREVDAEEAGITQEMIMRATAGMSEERRQREFGRKFLQPGGSVFQQEHLDACYQPIEDPNLQGVIDAYAEKVRQGKAIYYSGVDSALGRNRRTEQGDFHCYTALTESGIQVMCYLSKEPLSEWAGQIVDSPRGIGKEFVGGKVSALHEAYPGICQIEENQSGHTVINMHQTPTDGFSEMIPINTNSKTKALLINNLILAVETQQVIITDRATYDQMMTYQRGQTPGTFEASPGRNDDAVMALAMAWDAVLTYGQGAYDFGFEIVREDKALPMERGAYEIPEGYEEAELDFVYGPAMLPDRIDPNRRAADIFQDDIYDESMFPTTIEGLPHPDEHVGDAPLPPEHWR